jgi:hypothetical protein
VREGVPEGYPWRTLDRRSDDEVEFRFPANDDRSVVWRLFFLVSDQWSAVEGAGSS